MAAIPDRCLAWYFGPRRAGDRAAGAARRNAV